MSRIISASLWVGGGILFGRLFGFLREAIIAGNYGLSERGDILIVTLTIPDVLVSMLVGGGLSAVLLPEFQALSRELAYKLYFQSMLCVAAVFSLVAFISMFYWDYILAVLAPGVDAAQFDESRAFVQTVLWIVPLTALTGITTAWLHSQNRFAVVSIGSLQFNALVVAGLALVIVNQAHMAYVGVAAICGGGLRLGTQIVIGGFPRISFTPWMISGALLLRYSQSVVAGGLLYLIPVVMRAFASLAGAGALSSVNYSIRLIDLPLGVVVSVLQVVLFPRFARKYASSVSDEDYGDFLARFLLFVLITGLSIGLAISVFSTAFVDLVFGWGEMDTEAIAEVSKLTSAAAFLLPLQGAAGLLNVSILARKDVSGPLKISFVGLISYVAICSFIVSDVGALGVIYAGIAVYSAIVVLQILHLSNVHSVFVVHRMFKQGAATAIACIAAVAFVVAELMGVVSWGLGAKVISGVVMCLTLLATAYVVSPGLRSAYAEMLKS